MLRKKIISLVCLLILSIQVLPLRQIGSLLSSNQLTEELPHSACEIKSSVLKFEPTIPDPFGSAGVLQTDQLATNAIRFVHSASVLPAPHAGEIHTPPPNFI
jgi:hypothetical protein